MSKTIVLKISGHQIDDSEFLTSLAQTIARMQGSVIVVHGGGKEISEMQTLLGIDPHYVDGVRVTDARSLAIVTMVLCGTVNKRLVRYLLAEGLDAMGLSGIDRGIIRANKMPHPDIDMGYTGEVTEVNGEALLDLIAQGITPVVAPLSLGEDSHYNVNGDHVAGAIAVATQAERVIFLSNVEGVLVNDVVAPELTSRETDDLIQNGTIFGGMIPKVQMALHVLEAGVPQAVITNLKGLQTHGGTVFTQSK
ncbi:MAG: acetylglutamate kinase [Phototrophicaceae bacterium]